MSEINNILKTFDKPLLYPSPLAARVTSKLFIEPPNRREKRAK